MNKRKLYLFFSFKFVFFSSFILLVLRIALPGKLYGLITPVFFLFSLVFLLLYLPFFCRNYGIYIEDALIYTYGVFIKREIRIKFQDICATERKLDPFLYVFGKYRLKIYCKGIYLYIPYIDYNAATYIEMRGNAHGN